MSRLADPRPPKRPSKVRQACDPCHLRKIRCDGCRPCTNCQESTADCTYFAVHKKTGPKGGPRHARRPLQRRPPPVIWKYPLSSPGDRSADSKASQSKRTPESSSSDAAFQPSPQISGAVIQWCLNAYFKHKYPLTPILDRQQIEQIPSTVEQYGLIAACCAVIALSPEILLPSSAQDDLTIPPADFLISETLRSRQHCNLAENPSLTHIQTSFFLYAAFFCMEKDNSAWYYLREAITILQTLRLHEEATYSDADDPILATYARRMFWVLFITERAYALQRNRPITLQSTLNLPIVHPLSSDAEILLGFLDLVSLFRPFDSGFIANWNSATPSNSTDPAHLSRLQNLLKYTLLNVSNYSQVQQADLLVSRQWLKIIVWKLCTSKTMLSTASSEDVMSLHYPVSIARGIVLTSQLLPTQAFEANGIGILEKVFDVGCSLADLLSLVPAGSQGSAMDVGAIDTLMETVRIVGTRFGGSYRHLSMLADKASRCLLINVDRSLPLPVDKWDDTVD
ncbi:RING-3 [Mariannaea sp. PMI_226]|nr:RING-3 [Mariannaea sp. PMI_226]